MTYMSHILYSLLTGQKRIIPTHKDIRPCLWCGKLHDHNNGFHNVECCKAWQNQHKRELAEKREAAKQARAQRLFMIQLQATRRKYQKEKEART
jgi:hypothetical protein